MPDEHALTSTEKRAQKPREPSAAEVTAMIADQLGETRRKVRQKIFGIVKALGRTQSRRLLGEALQIEEHGGMMTLDGSRRRTVGGIFFHLAYTTGKPKPGRTFQNPMHTRAKGKEQPEPGEPQPEATPTARPSSQAAIPFTWDDRIPTIEEAESEKGTANVKITLIGRPGKIVDRGQCIVTMMEDSKTPALPKGLPTPTSTPTKYAVYIASKQWAKVKDTIADPEDMLIIEGFPKTDPEVTAIAVFTTNVTTKKIQALRREKPSK